MRFISFYIVALHAQVRAFMTLRLVLVQLSPHGEAVFQNVALPAFDYGSGFLPARFSKSPGGNCAHSRRTRVSALRRVPTPEHRRKNREKIPGTMAGLFPESNCVFEVFSRSKSPDGKTDYCLPEDQKKLLKLSTAKDLRFSVLPIF